MDVVGKQMKFSISEGVVDMLIMNILRLFRYVSFLIMLIQDVVEMALHVSQNICGVAN